MKTRSILVLISLLSGTGLTGVASAPPAAADHALAPPDPSQMDYTPIGYYGPADEQTVAGSTTIPAPGDYPTGPPFVDDPNPTGKFVAYDRNVWEALSLPSRHPGDNCNDLPADAKHPDCRAGDEDPDGDGPSGYSRHDDGSSTIHGTCPPEPTFIPYGMCDNNQLEYLDYYESEMETEFADLGVTVRRYPFISPGAGTPRGAYLSASGGQAYNIAAVIPGADHPEETVIVGAHYDFTDSGPGAAWDSQEGHTEIMRMAWLMADYYRKTGTRPSATLKFVPWDSEESGTHGSIDYVRNNIPPGETDEVRGYFNVDPCAGAYPAFEENTNRQVNQVLQLADPTPFESQPEVKARIESFNATAEQVIDQVLEYLDDSLTRHLPVPGTEVPIFVSDAEATAGNDGTQAVTASDRGKIVTALGGLALFGSDYSNFQGQGIPIFNFFPDYFGPHADGSPSDGGAKGLEILHTNNDNLRRINRLTSGLGAANLPDPIGDFASEGWAKGQEFCAQVEAWGMLQPNAAGAQTANTNPVAYFEALPNEALQNQQVTFDANGSYQYSNVNTRAMHALPNNAFNWDFGDGTSATGKVVQHAYPDVGRYNATLTVNGVGGPTDSMTIPIEVIPSSFAGPVLDTIQPEDAKDGNYELNWDFTSSRSGFEHFRVEESFDFAQLFADQAESETLDNWMVAPPSHPDIEPWQPSDSSTQKFRGNQAHSGDRSFWTGSSPPFPQPPTIAQGNSYLTLKNPITVPTEGEPELQYWSIFQNEGDDTGRVEVALTDGSIPPEQLNWDTVDLIQAVNTAAGGPPDNAVCDPSNPQHTLGVGFEGRRVSLARFRGQQILVRFNYAAGAENRVPSQPCGWYVDDVSLYSGNWDPVGTTTDQQFLVTDRPNLLWAYRVKGVYNDGVTTASSNVEIANVTDSRNIPKKDLLRCLRIDGKHILGSVKKDKLIGTEGPEVICGFGGNDKIKALGGDDVGLGFKGKDRVDGGNDDDRLLGDQGNDRLKGGKGRDKLKGGKGKDRLNGGPGKDRCSKKGDTIKKC